MSSPPRDISWGQVAGAAVGGLLLEWLVIAFFVLATLHEDVGAVAWVVVFLGAPALFTLMLLPRGTRHGSAGVLIGLLLGSITGAGVCSGLTLLGG